MSERPERFPTVSSSTLHAIDQPAGAWEKLWGNALLRKVVILAVLATAWEIYAFRLGKPFVIPTFLQTVAALAANIQSGAIPKAAGHTLVLLFQGYGLGLLFAVILTALASASRIGADLLETLTSMFHPLPSIALLPIALLWFRLGDNAVIFVLVHAVLWSVALNTHAGFRAVSPTWRMVGQNYGLSTPGYIARILIPGAFPSILTGLKTGWAFAWRTLIAAELVFGVSSGSGGIGWYIYERKNNLLIPEVFAGLLTVILFGLAVDNFVFKTIEKHTVRRWGMET